MNGPSVNDRISPELERQIGRLLFEKMQPLLLEFDRDWHLVNLHGDAALFGFAPDDAATSVQQLQDLFLGMPMEAAIDLAFVQMPNGRNAHVHLMLVDGGHQVLLIDAQGEHDRQQAQQQVGNESFLIAQQKDKAVRQLRQIRSELESQRNRLQEANALKNALIATLSHDFRTPLASIFGYLHLLEEEPDAPLETRNSLRALRRNANYLFALAENLLEYARSETRSSLLAPVVTDLQMMVEDLDQMFRVQAEDVGLGFSITLDQEPGEPPILDELRLRQILVNLIANAIRYTQSGSVKASLAWRGGSLVLSVRDTGVGIAQEASEAVFVPFNRAGNAGNGGAGLGLSIVKRLVQQMLGTLEFESKLGKGTCFRIELPDLTHLVQKVDARAESEAGQMLAERASSVLIVDDDPDMLHLLSEIMAGVGFRVRVVADATRAVEQALADPPDILLVDVELPGLSGNTAVFRLRAKGYRGHVVTISATPTEEARKVALNAGANQFMTKPINIEQFTRAMLRVRRLD